MAYNDPTPAGLALAGKQYKVTIPKQIYDQVMHWVWKAGRNEISGFGTVVFDEAAKEFIIKKAILLDQENQSAHTEINGEALSKAMYELREGPGEIRWWWHSHVQMGVFWSGTDMDTIRELGSRGWILATVFNQKEERRSAFLTVAESALTAKHEIFVDEIPTTAVSFYDPALFAEWDAAFDAKVKEKKWLAPTRNSASAGANTNTSNSVSESPVVDAMYERKALEEFEWFSSEYFTKDGRFAWKVGSSNDSGIWTPGEWQLVESLKDRADRILPAKIHEIKKSLRRMEPITAEDMTALAMLNAHEVGDRMDSYGYPI